MILTWLSPVQEANQEQHCNQNPLVQSHIMPGTEMSRGICGDITVPTAGCNTWWTDGHRSEFMGSVWREPIHIIWICSSYVANNVHVVKKQQGMLIASIVVQMSLHWYPNNCHSCCIHSTWNKWIPLPLIYLNHTVGLTPLSISDILLFQTKVCIKQEITL